MEYDLVVRNGRVVDPANGRDEVADVGVTDGKVSAVGAGLDVARARRVIDATGRLVMPGIVDPHVHLARNGAGHRMIAKVGVITAIDASGPLESVVRTTKERGAGLNVACCDAVLHRGDSNDPSKSAIESQLERSLADGAIGLKIFGGHDPLTPEATQRIIEATNKLRAHAIFHVGTTEFGSNIEGLRQAVAMTKGGLGLNIAHISGYVRGWVAHPLDEVREAIDLLNAAGPHVVGDSYMFKWNMNVAKCVDGVPVGLLTKRWLTHLGYPATEAGLLRAVAEHRARILTEQAGESVALSGDEGIAVYHATGGDTWVSFPVNLLTNQFVLATARDDEGGFAIDAFCTDGGDAPRNVTVRAGLAIVRYGELTLSDFVRKASLAGARMVGLVNKGHLGPGADGDITVIDLAEDRAVLGVARGRVIMVDGVVVGDGGTFLINEAAKGSKLLRSLPTEVVDTSKSLLYSRYPSGPVARAAA
jgi:hypothetical protein